MVITYRRVALTCACHSQLAPKRVRHGFPGWMVARGMKGWIAACGMDSGMDLMHPVTLCLFRYDQG